VLAGVGWQLRLALTSLLTLALLGHGSAHLAIFLAGMALADIRLARSHGQELGQPRETNIFVRLISWCTLVLSLWLGSYPWESPEASWGYASLAPWTPEVYSSVPGRFFFWNSLGAILLIASLDQLQGARDFFNSRFMVSCMRKKEKKKKLPHPDVARLNANALPQLYLGDISFGLYLVHWTVLYTMTRRIMESMVLAGYSVDRGFLVATVPTVLVCFWLADLHWRLADKPSVFLTRFVKFSS
jgi:peptidoglycan/LPS O-acetylase OafA/YrhL